MDSTLAGALPPLVPARELAMRFTFAPRGARFARRLVSHRLDQWGYGYGSVVLARAFEGRAA